MTFKHLLPTGFITDVFGTLNLNQSGHVPGLYFKYRQSLHSALIYPTCRDLCLPGYAYFNAAGIGEINNMRLKAEYLTPSGLSAGTRYIMTGFRLHNTHITLG